MKAIAHPLALADWRRQVAELYAQVRAAPNRRSAWRRWRDGRDSLFAAHSQSPLDPARRGAFAGLPLFDYDPALAFEVAVVPPAPAELAESTPWPRLDLDGDGTVLLQPAGRTEGLAPALGGELDLYWIAGYGGGLFLPFADASNGHETYGGGRYLLDGIKGTDLGVNAEGRLICDFNFAYNPSCAYDEVWGCPLPPAGNALPVAVRGGEKAPAT